MFSNWVFKSFRVLLIPFAILFWLGARLRNWMYDRGMLRSAQFGLPLICVGNLAVGGTGKSPMVELILRLLRDRYKAATLSRGYKRKTKGYALAGPETTAIEIGDEPMQFHTKFPEVPVAVGEERLVAVPQLLHDHPETEVVILDDAFQHRAISAGLNILLTDHGNLFTRDFFLPTGDLRDERRSYKRAQIIVVTKCPTDLSPQEADKIRKEINPLPGQSVYFTTIRYGTPYHITRKDETVQITESLEVLLVTGIANPRPLKALLEEHSGEYQMVHYADHHIFSIDDFKDINKKFNQIESSGKILLTTEKDAMRLLKFGGDIAKLPFYVIPIEHQFLFEQEHAFAGQLTEFIDQFKLKALNYGQEEFKEN